MMVEWGRSEVTGGRMVRMELARWEALLMIERLAALLQMPPADPGAENRVIFQMDNGDSVILALGPGTPPMEPQ